eukprot:TRINITY_DN9401_c0_g1_i11.p1 TRINITY_DN9401_c0_g1~~TRINITY_DN9401_c0_g1_i11.p1  ORF type:complete len:354 (+),score=94.39 TRINITY_DN9401_c0_g1_i11:55-1116(+)
MSVAVASPSVDDTLRKVQSHFRELIGLSNLETVLHGIVSALRAHEDQFVRHSDELKVMISIEASLMQVNARMDKIEARLHEKDEEGLKLLEMVRENGKKIAVNQERIEKLEQDLQLIRMTRDGRDRDIIEIKDSLRGISQHFVRVEQDVDECRTEIKSNNDNVIHFRDSFSKRLGNMDTILAMKADSDSVQPILSAAEKDCKDLRMGLGVLGHRLERYERGFAMEMQTINRKLDEKMDKNAVDDIQDLLSKAQGGEGAFGASNANGITAKLQLRCLSCHSIVPTGANDQANKSDPNMNGSFQSFVQTVVQQTKQFNIVGADGRLYKGRDEIIAEPDEVKLQQNYTTSKESSSH